MIWPVSRCAGGTSLPAFAQPGLFAFSTHTQHVSYDAFAAYCLDGRRGTPFICGLFGHRYGVACHVREAYKGVMVVGRPLVKLFFAERPPLPHVKPDESG